MNLPPHRPPIDETRLPLAEMAARSIPADGDIVIRTETQEQRVVYILRTAPGADQYLLHNREEAIAQALTFAKLRHVRAWLTVEGHDFQLLEDARIVKSV